MVKTPDECELGLNHITHDAFRAHFRDLLARFSDLLAHEFCSYLVDLLRFREAGAACCKGVITECEVHDALEQVGLNELLGIDGLPYEVYLRLLHMSGPILTDVFINWFHHGAIPCSVTEGVITLSRKWDKHV